MGLIKRAIPFFATFAIALFVTSFFVDLRRPSFGRGRGHARQEIQRLRAEVDRVNAELEQVRAENAQLRSLAGARSWTLEHHPDENKGPAVEFSVPMLPLPPPPMPVAPHAHK